MSVPAGLFIDSPEMADVSLTRLGNEPESWPEEVVQKIKERIPKASSLNMMVKFMKQDDETGTATGSVIINSTEKTGIVPVVIKEFMLSPLDIFMVDNKILPLTPDYFDSVFLNNNLFQKLEEYPYYSGLGRFDGYHTNLNEVIYPPNMGRYSYASGGYPILEHIAGTINNSGEFKDYFKQNPNVYANFKKHGNDAIVAQLTKIQPVNMNAYGEAIRDLLPRNLMMVKKIGYDNYSLLANSDKVFDPRIISNMRRCDLREVVGKFSDDSDSFLNDVDRSGEKFLTVESESGNDPYLFEPSIDKVEMCNEYGHYHLKKLNGVLVSGFVIPKVINFEMERVPMKLFIGDTMSTMQQEFAGVHFPTDKKIHTCVPRIGMTGSFVYVKDKKAIGTVPVTVITVSSSPSDIKVVVQDLNGKKFTVCFCQGDNHLESIAYLADKNTFLMPKGFLFCPMEGFHELTATKESFHIKTAGDKVTANPMTIIHTGYGYHSVKGVDKYASACGFDKSNVPEHGVKFLMLSLGVKPSMFGEILKTAKIHGKADIHMVSRPSLLKEKIASKRPLAERMSKIAGMLRTNLIKEASYIENSQTVDSLLSLNFINPENISKFINLIPQFKATISSLCSCLLGSRLGVQEIEESAASTAMYRLIDVVNGLERLRAIQEHGG